MPFVCFKALDQYVREHRAEQRSHLRSFRIRNSQEVFDASAAKPLIVLVGAATRAHLNLQNYPVRTGREQCIEERRQRMVIKA